VTPTPPTRAFAEPATKKVSKSNDFMNLIDMMVDATAKRGKGRPKGSPNVKKKAEKPPNPDTSHVQKEPKEVK
jgi:hypothetical protein